MKQNLYLVQFVIVMILFSGITSLALEVSNYAEKKGKKAAKKSTKKAVKKVSKVNVVLQAIAHLACAAKGRSKCMAAKIKTHKCKVAAWKAPTKAVVAYKAALKKKNVKGQMAASVLFKNAMKPIIGCNILPTSYKTAFAGGFKIVGGKKAKKAVKKAKKAAKKAKKAVKKAKKAKKAVKKVVKKVKKVVKKGGKKSKKAAKKAVKKAKKAKKLAYLATLNSLRALRKLCK